MRVEIADDVEPEVGRQAQRLDVDSLIVAVETPCEVAARQCRVEQSCAVRYRAALAKYACVGEAHVKYWRQPRRRKMFGDGPLDRVPQACVHRARRWQVREEGVDLDIVGEISQGV